MSLRDWIVIGTISLAAVALSNWQLLLRYSEVFLSGTISQPKNGGQIVKVGFQKIVDGDTLLFPDLRVHFAKIDACEKGQKASTKLRVIDCGAWAKKHLENLINQREVVCWGDRFDAFDRLIAECRANGIADLGLYMLRQGYAFPYRPDRLPNSAKHAYKTARLNSQGIWGFVSVEKPHIWRQNHKRK